MRILHVGDDFAALRPCGLTLYSQALMDAQAAAGHEVSYVFSGRVYPRLARPRLKRWTRGPVKMYELIGSPNHSHWLDGTRHPELDLQEAAGEATFAAAVREASPELVHIHELARLPSSVIEHAKARGLPVVMSLYDYKPLCASVRLIDADGKPCRRTEVGPDCARNCAGAPDGPQHLIDWTLRYERRRAKRAVPVIRSVDLTLLNPLVGRATRMLTRSESKSGPQRMGGDGGRAPSPPLVLQPAGYQHRRDLNVARLGLCDRLLAMSKRLAEIYATLGVRTDRMTIQRFTLPHIAGLVPARGPEVGRPLTFVTPGGCASASKGSRAVLEAVRTLEAAGRRDDYRLLVLGSVEPAVERELASIPSVSMVGPYSTDDLDRMLDRPDIGIIPSTWEEAFGFVGIELLAKGIPVIGSALGGITEYVRDGETGWLNRSASGAELGELMLRALDHPDQVERLRASVRARRAEFVRSMDEHLAEVEAVYQELSV